MEALEKLQMCDSTIRNHSFEEMTQCTEGIINYAVNRYFKAKYLIERTNRILPIRSNSLASASENLRKEIAAKRINEKEKKLGNIYFLLFVLFYFHFIYWYFIDIIYIFIL